MYGAKDLFAIIATLRSDHGCPWDREQTFESLKKCLADETQEVLQAVDNKDMENLCEELGDVLLNVVMYSQIAGEQGQFTIQDVIDGVCRKMIRRHPHVFGDAKAGTPAEGRAMWDEIKRQEKEARIAARGTTEQPAGHLADRAQGRDPQGGDCKNGRK